MKAVKHSTLLKRVKSETEKYVNENLSNIKFQMYEMITPEIVHQTIAFSLYILSLNGYGKKRLQDIFANMKSMQEGPVLYNKEFPMSSFIELMKEKYEIDVTTFPVKLLTEEEWRNRK